MPTIKNGPTRAYFAPRIERAKRALEKEAGTAIKHLIRASEKAAERGNHEPAAWILSHIAVVDPETGKELRPIAPSIDKPAAQLQGDTGPKILIGIQVAGAQLPAVEPKTLGHAPNPRLGAQPEIIDTVESTTYDEPSKAKVEGES